MSATELKCWNCGESLAEVPRPISRHEQCPECFEALHCCRLCHHHRTDVTGACDEERADPPVIKENANFCDWFRPDAGAFVGSRVEKSAAAQGRLDALFGGSEDEGEQTASTGNADQIESDEKPLSAEDEARAKLNDLFSKE
jgi:hypothetical protein